MVDMTCIRDRAVLLLGVLRACADLAVGTMAGPPRALISGVRLISFAMALAAMVVSLTLLSSALRARRRD